MVKIVSQDDFTVGKQVIPYAHRRCQCSNWFKFRYDEAVNSINVKGFYTVACPCCEREYTYEREMHIPDQYMKFVEVD